MGKRFKLMKDLMTPDWTEHKEYMCHDEELAARYLLTAPFTVSNVYWRGFGVVSVRFVSIKWDVLSATYGIKDHTTIDKLSAKEYT